MAKQISSLNVVLGATVSPFVSAFQRAQSVAEGMTRTISNIGSKLLELTGVAAIAAAGFAAVRSVFGSFTDSISLASQLEQAAVAFETMTGSGRVAKKLLEELSAFAATTPYQFPELATGAKQLLAFGITADQIMPSLAMLGDIAAGTGAELGNIILAYGQVKVRAKLSGEEIRQFVSAGIPLVGLLAKQFGVAESEIYKMTEAGKIGFGDVQKALQKLTGPGGQFANMMAKQSKTLGGLWSTLTDNISLTLAKLVQRVVDVFKIKDGLAVLIDSTGKAGAILEAKVAEWAPKILRAGTQVKDAVASIARDMAGVARSAYDAVAPVVGAIFSYVAPIVMRLGQQLADGFKKVYDAAAEAGRIIWGIVAPIGRAWATSENLVLTVRTLASAYVTATLAAKAWWVSTVALSASQYAASTVARAYAAAVRGVMIASRGVAAAQNLAKAAGAETIIVNTVATARTIVAAAATHAASAAVRSWTAAKWLSVAAFGALRSALLSTLSGQTLYRAGLATLVAIDKAYTTVRWASLTAWQAIRVAMTTTTAWTYLYAAGQNAAAAAVAGYTTVQWAARAAVIAFDGTLAGSVAAIAAVRTVIATTTTGVYAMEAAHLAGRAAVAVATAVQWAAITAWTAFKTAIVTTTAIEYLYVAANYAGVAAVLAFTGAKAAATGVVTTFTAMLSVARLQQLAWQAATLLATGAQIAWTAAITAGNAIMTGLAAIFNAASIASAAWTVATGVATAAQWLLNIALNANPVGLVVIGITALAAAFVAVGGAAAVVIGAMAGISAGSEWIKKAFEVAEFAAKNWRLTLQVVGAEVSYFAVRTAAQIAYTFTEVIPATLTWLQGNWKSIFKDILSFTETVFLNLLTNASNLGESLWEAIKGNGFTFDWTPLTAGFESAIKEMPKIAERQVGPLESQLGEAADRAMQRFKDGMKGVEANDDTAIFFADATKSADDFAKEAEKAAANMKPPELPKVDLPKIDPLKIDTTQATKSLTDVGKKAQDLDAIVAGSAESLKLRFAGMAEAKAAANAGKPVLGSNQLTGMTPIDKSTSDLFFKPSNLATPPITPAVSASPGSTASASTLLATPDMTPRLGGGNASPDQRVGLAPLVNQAATQAAPIPKSDLMNANVITDKNTAELVALGGKQTGLLSDLITTTKTQTTLKKVNF